MKRYSLLLTFIILGFTINAQNFKYGKVSKSELQELNHPIDSSAGAAVLFHSSTTKFTYEETNGFIVETFVHTRIKIYSKEGLKWATKRILLREIEGMEEIISVVKGTTFLYTNGDVRTVKLKKSAVNNENLNEFWNEVTFTMPEAEVGCVIEYKYMIRSPFYWDLPVYDLQFNIPTNKLKYHFEAPEYYDYKMNLTGILPITPELSTRIENISLSSGNTTSRGPTSLSRNQPTAKADFSRPMVPVVYNVTQIELDNVDALISEPLIDNLDNYRNRIRFELKFVQLPNQPAKYENSGWDDVTRNLNNSRAFGMELAKDHYYKVELEQVISKSKTKDDLLVNIFYLVKNKVKWNRFSNIYTNIGVREAFKSGEGNIAEINLMLTSMLKYAGFEAYPVITSTITNGKPVAPTTNEFDYVLAGVIKDDRIFLLDASGRNNGVSTLPFRALNWNGRMLRPDGTSLSVNLYPLNGSANIKSLSYEVFSSGLIKGTARIQYNFYDALDFRNNYLGMSKELYLKSMVQELGDFEVKEYQVKDVSNYDKPIVETYQFESKNDSKVNGDSIYLNPLVFLRLEDNMFKSSTRKFPMYFKYPFKDKVTILIKIPKGYVVKDIPENVVIKLSGNMGSYKFYTSLNGETITLMTTIQVKETVIGAEYYEEVKELYERIIIQESTPILLVKDTD